MRRPSFGAWVLAFAWCGWAAFAGALLEEEAGGWAPDLLLLIVAAVVTARGRRAHLGLAACAACARSALSLTAPLVLLSATALAFLAARGVAGVLDREGLLGRLGIAGAAALTFHGWRALACASRGEPGAFEGLVGPVLVTTVLAPLLLPVLVRLPGLRPFTGRRA